MGVDFHVAVLDLFGCVFPALWCSGTPHQGSQVLFWEQHREHHCQAPKRHPGQDLPTMSSDGPGSGWNGGWPVTRGGEACHCCVGCTRHAYSPEEEISRAGACRFRFSGQN